ncbi:MAG: TetR/AcrR family transcriptional regulator [Thermoleophilia bacterium]
MSGKADALGDGRAKDARDAGPRLPMPAEMPLSAMPPVARALVEAARRLLGEKGFKALSLEAIAREAGENKAMVRYYFGDKDGLLAALVDSLIRDNQVAVNTEMRALPPGPARIHAWADGLRRVAADTDSFYALFNLVPHILGSDRLRPRIAELYSWYRGLNVEACLPEAEEGDPSAAGLGALLTAVVDGIALQALLDPDDFDPNEAFRTLGNIVEAYATAGGTKVPPANCRTRRKPQ